MVKKKKKKKEREGKKTWTFDQAQTHAQIWQMKKPLLKP